MLHHSRTIRIARVSFCLMIQLFFAAPMTPVQAAAPHVCRSALPGYHIAQMYMVTPEIAPQQSVRRDVFHQRSYTLDSQDGDKLLLSGAAGGKEGFFSDDFLTVTTTDGGQWEQDFHASRTPERLIPLPAQDLTGLLAEETTAVTVTLQNRVGETAGSSALWLTLFRPCPEGWENALLAQVATPTPTPMPKPTATGTPTAARAVALVQPTPQPTLTATGTSTPRPALFAQAGKPEGNTAMLREKPQHLPIRIRLRTLLPLLLGIFLYWWIVIGKPNLFRSLRKLRKEVMH